MEEEELRPERNREGEKRDFGGMKDLYRGKETEKGHKCVYIYILNYKLTLGFAF